MSLSKEEMRALLENEKDLRKLVRAYMEDGGRGVFLKGRFRVDVEDLKELLGEDQELRKKFEDALEEVGEQEIKWNSKALQAYLLRVMSTAFRDDPEIYKLALDGYKALVSSRNKLKPKQRSLEEEIFEQAFKDLEY